MLASCYWTDTCMVPWTVLPTVAARHNSKLSFGQLQLAKMGFVNSFTHDFEL